MSRVREALKSINTLADEIRGDFRDPRWECREIQKLVKEALAALDEPSLSERLKAKGFTEPPDSVYNEALRRSVKIMDDGWMGGHHDELVEALESCLEVMENSGAAWVDPMGRKESDEYKQARAVLEALTPPKDKSDE